MRWSFALLAASVVAVLGLTLALGWRPWSSGHNETPALFPSLDPVATWVTDGEVDDLAQAGGRVYAAGSFTRVTSWTGGVGAVGAQSGQIMEGLPWIDGDVTAIVSDRSGGWYIGGDFDRSEGGRCPNLVHVLASGGVDPRFCGEVEDVEHLALAGGRLYVATGCCDDSPGELVALDPAAGRALGWILEAEGGYSDDADQNRNDVAAGFRALASDGETLYVGGYFSRLNGQPRTHLASVAGRTGELLPWSPRIDGDYHFSPTDDASDEGIPFPQASVVALTVSEGALLVGGTFGRIDSQQRSSLASFDLARGRLSGWVPEGRALRGGVEAIAAGSSGVAVAAGRFDAGTEIVRYPETTTETPQWEVPVDYRVDDLALDDEGRLIAVGDFSRVGADARSYAAMLTAEGRLSAWRPAPTHVASVALTDGDRVLLGGHFAGLGGAKRDGLAALDARSGELLPWQPSVEEIVYRDEIDASNAPSYALAANEERLYVFGDFKAVDGIRRERLAAFRLMDGRLEEWSPDAVPRGVTSAAITADNEAVYLGFGTWVGDYDEFVSSAVAVDGGDGDTIWTTPRTWDVDVNALARAEDELWVGGDGEPYVARLDAGSGEPVTEEMPSFDAEVDDLATDRGIVYVTGGFSEVGGQPRFGVAALRGSMLEAWNPALTEGDNYTFDEYIDVAGSHVYIAGNFAFVKNRPRVGLAAVTQDTADPITWPSPDVVVSGSPVAGGEALAVKTEDSIRIFPLRTRP